MDIDDVPELSGSSSDDDNDDEAWKEPEPEVSEDECLFCKRTFSEVDSALVHCKDEHGFDLRLLKMKHDMDFYSYVKLIGYIRRERPDPLSIMNASVPPWDRDEYLKPVHVENWLMYDFDSLDEDLERTTSFQANVENGVVTMSEAHFFELQRTMRSLRDELKRREEGLRTADVHMKRMRSVVHTLVNDGPVLKTKEQRDDDEDDGYFGTYAHFGVHHEMLSDRVRTEAYRDAIFRNASLLQGRVVLDLGCGTGILSMMCASAGASKVYAVDGSDVARHAVQIIKENALDDRITVIRGRIEEIRLPGKVDAVVSEWMGYFLLFEGMLDSLVYTRDHYLAPGGTLLPNRCTLSAVGSGDVAAYDSLIGFWSDVYGFKMTSMRNEAIKEGNVSIADSTKLITSPCVILDLDLYTCTVDSIEFSSDFFLEVLHDGVLTSLVGYFDTFFDLPDPVSFSTGPDSAPTHWKQTIFYFEKPIAVKKGERLACKLTCRRNTSDPRGLIVNVAVPDRVHSYLLN